MSVTTRSAPATASFASWVSSTTPPFFRAQATNSSFGSKPGGVAQANVKPKRAAASAKVAHTLLPSPAHATRLPRMEPRCSS